MGSGIDYLNERSNEDGIRTKSLVFIRKKGGSLSTERRLTEYRFSMELFLFTRLSFEIKQAKHGQDNVGLVSPKF